ncbi:MAG: hypothetical protein AAF317_12805 [Pseudomonadota bacterium]
MRIKNLSRSKVYWRAFKHTDSINGVWLRDGLIDAGKTASWNNQSFPKIKVEIKTHGLFQKILAEAGTHFDIGDDLIFDGKTLKRAAVDRGPMTEVTITRDDEQVIDLRRFDNQIDRIIESHISQVFSSSTGVEKLSANETTWAVGGEVGGKLAKVPGATGKLSADWTNKITETVKTDERVDIQKFWSTKWTDKVPLAPGKIHVIRVTWVVTCLTGRFGYFGETGMASMMTSATPRMSEFSSYDKVEEVPEETRALLSVG